MAEIIYQLEGLEKLDKELKYLQSHAVKVGVLGNGSAERRAKNKAKRKLMKRKGLLKKGGSFSSRDKTRKKSKSALIEEYAVFNEYGTSLGIPARPFFRLSVKTSRAQKEIKEYMKAQLEMVISGEMTGEEAYNNLGTFLVQKIKKTIMSGSFAANKDATVKKKGQSTPLVDTHSLYNSISYEIVGA